jgi:hypothetical protein
MVTTTPPPGIATVVGPEVILAHEAGTPRTAVAPWGRRRRVVHRDMGVGALGPRLRTGICPGGDEGDDNGTAPRTSTPTRPRLEKR